MVAIGDTQEDRLRLGSFACEQAHTFLLTPVDYDRSGI